MKSVMSLLKIWSEAGQTMMKTGKRQKGFTLIEMMIALTVLALVVAAVSHALSQSLAMAHRIKKDTTLSLLAQSKMAEIEAAEEGAASDHGNFGGNFSQYGWQVSVRGSGIPTLKKVEVTVWDTLSEKRESFRLTSLQYREESP